MNKTIQFHDDSGDLVPVRAIDNVDETYSLSIGGAVGISDGANLDGFSRLRVSSPKSIFHSTFRYNLHPLIYEQITATSGTITHVPNIVSAELKVTGTNGSSAILQSRQYHRYIPTKSHMIAMTQVIGSPVANVRKRVGYFDAGNGLFLEQNGTIDIAFVRRTSTSGSPVDNRVVQADWNLDKLDGTGASGITLDLSKASILFIDFQWLGMGRVRIGFDIDGKVIYAHEFLNANVLSVPYMQTGTLPIRWEIASVGTSAGTLMYATCASVVSEGGDESTESYLFSVANSGNVTAGTRTPLLAIRPKATFNGVVNRIEIAITEYSVFAGNNPVLVELIYKPSAINVTGAWDSVNDESCVEAHGVITGITGGTIIGSFFVPSSAANRQALSDILRARLPITLDAAGANPISVVVCATSLNSTSACRARLDWHEMR